jgi:hypothetical protein
VRAGGLTLFLLACMSEKRKLPEPKGTELATAPIAGEVLLDEKLFQEINLLRIKGHLFNFSPRRSGRRPDTVKIIEKSIKLPTGDVLSDQPLLFETNPNYGWPEELSYKILQATLKKLSDEGYENADSVVLGFREIARVIGRKQGPNSFGKSDSTNFIRAIKKLRYTGIECTLYNKENERALTYNFSIYSNALFLTEKGKIRTCAVMLDPEIRRNLNSRYTFCLNYSRLLRFRGSGMMLYEQLFFAMGKLYSRVKNKDFVFTKDYEDVSTTWLGGLTIYQFKSQIEEQLGPHLEDLKREKVIRSYKIEPAKGEGFNIRFSPGSGFFEDYARFYTKVRQPQLPFARAQDENLIQRPLSLIYYFHQKRLGVTDLVNTDFPTKDIEFAQELGAKYADGVCRSYLDFGLTKAKEGKFSVQTLSGIRQYLNEFLATQAEREHNSQKALEKKKKDDLERLRNEYDLRMKTHVMRLRDTMSADALAELERPIIEEHRRKYPHDTWSKGVWVLLRGNEIIAQRHKLPTFEQWMANPGTLP